MTTLFAVLFAATSLVPAFAEPRLQPSDVLKYAAQFSLPAQAAFTGTDRDGRK